MKTKICSGCGLDKPVEHFRKRKGHGGYVSRCHPCEKAQRKSYYDQDDRRRKGATDWMRAEKVRRAGRAKPEHCEVCGSGGNICWDHDHETGEFRGWLCDACNRALGHAKEDPTRLRALALYAERIQERR